MMICEQCGRELPDDQFDDLVEIDVLQQCTSPEEIDRAPVVGKLTMCYECIDECAKYVAAKMDRREEYRTLRDECVARLGGCCAVCGETDWRVLQIDHIDGDGAEDRARFKRGSNSSTTYLQHILKNPSKYQILCANHNWIKRVENNEGLPKNRRKS